MEREDRFLGKLIGQNPRRNPERDDNRNHHEGTNGIVSPRRAGNRPRHCFASRKRESPVAAYERTVALSRGRLVTEPRVMREGRLAPDDAFLVEEVVDYFDAFTHLGLSLFRHRQNGPDDFARFHIIQRRNPLAESLLAVLSVARHGLPFVPSFRFHSYFARLTQRSCSIRTTSIAHVIRDNG